jgi:hypothetical protein
MPHSSPEDQPSIRLPHPLALQLIERLRAHPQSRILEFCTGSGRNAAALRAAGFTVVGLEDPAADAFDRLSTLSGSFAAILSTHGLLHDSPAAVGERVTALAALLDSEGTFHAAFGSVRDARFGRGTRLDARTFAPSDGDERGIAHAYFTRAELERLLAPHLQVERLDERDADAVAGAWAHPLRPLAGAVHWFVTAHRHPLSPKAMSS